MHKIFSPETISTEVLVCSECHWEGKGSDTRQEDLFLTDAVELFCPDCGHYLGFVSQEQD